MSIDLSKLTDKQRKLLLNKLREMSGLEPYPTGRGRPAGSKNGTSTKPKSEPREKKKKRPGSFNPTTNILNGRPRPVCR